MFFMNSFYIFYKIVLLHFFSFFQGMQTRERAHCARSVFPFIKKKKKNGAARWLAVEGQILFQFTPKDNGEE